MQHRDCEEDAGRSVLCKRSVGKLRVETQKRQYFINKRHRNMMFCCSSVKGWRQ